MGKKIRLKEQRRRNAEQAVSARLEAHSKTYAAPAAVTSFEAFAPALRAQVDAYRGWAIRPPEAWRCRIKSRCEQRRFLELVRFAFARYPIAPHLERLWIDDPHYVLADRLRAPGHSTAFGRVDLRRWHLIAAQGGSLHKEVTHAFFTKAETHHFLTAPANVGGARRAFWYAVARAQTDAPNVALRVAQTKLADFSVASAFWREAARFFARHPLPPAEMDDVIDFLLAAKEQDDAFSLKGRSVEALRRRVTEWHRALRKQRAVCGGRWDGHPLPDVEYEAGSEHRIAIWRFRQIKTGNDLFREGQRMHHCVATYKVRCMTGQVSIWSLTCEFPRGKLNRGVTMEVRNDGAIVQCRGFANRLPYANEVAMVKRWANDHGLAWRAIG